MIKEFAIILAGGKGTRLWPLSRQDYPKQFAQFIDGESLFQLTIKRLQGYFKSRNVLIVTSENYKFHIINQIETASGINQRDKGALKKNIILEPYPKSTAPAVMLAMKSLPGNHNNDIFFVFPSDQIIAPIAKFNLALIQAGKLARDDYVVIFGIKPDRPRSGYGYVIIGKKIKGGFKVRRFIEKPSANQLKKLIREKAYWNAGIFVFKPKIFFKDLADFSPNIFEYSQRGYAYLKNNFLAIQPDSIDYAIMQKTKRAVLVEFKGQWSDLGSWDSVEEYFSRSKKLVYNKWGNSHIGKAEFLNSHSCFSFSKDKFISFIGLKDVLVIEESDSILIMKRGQSDKVKELARKLHEKALPQLNNSSTVYRPWGYYTILKEKSNYKVKEIGIYPKKFISLQKHNYRSEHWNVVAGKATITLGKRIISIKKNESIFVPCGIKHKVFNPSPEVLKIIEVQLGSYLGEDDITRFDSY